MEVLPCCADYTTECSAFAHALKAADTTEGIGAAAVPETYTAMAAMLQGREPYRATVQQYQAVMDSPLADSGHVAAWTRLVGQASAAAAVLLAITAVTMAAKMA